MEVIKSPKKIIDTSFSLVKEALGEHTFTEEEFPIVVRITHSTGDPQFGKEVRFRVDSISSGVEALRGGCSIVVDVNMVKSGISKTLMKKLGVRCVCHIADKDIFLRSEEQDITRSELAMKKARDVIQGGIVAIGNAPTALFEVIRLIREEDIRPALVIGFPVGFVGAVESKRELVNTNVPFITNLSKRGGTPVAVSTINALLKITDEGG